MGIQPQPEEDDTVLKPMGEPLRQEDEGQDAFEKEMPEAESPEKPLESVEQRLIAEPEDENKESPSKAVFLEDNAVNE